MQVRAALVSAAAALGGGGGASVVSAVVGLAGISSASFAAAQRAQFAAGVGSALGMAPSVVNVTAVEDYATFGASGRKLLLTAAPHVAVSVWFTVRAASPAAAANLATALTVLLAGSPPPLLLALQAAGLAVTGVEQIVAPMVGNVARAPPPPPPPSETVSDRHLLLATLAVLPAAGCMVLLHRCVVRRLRSRPPSVRIPGWEQVSSAPEGEASYDELRMDTHPLNK